MRVDDVICDHVMHQLVCGNYNSSQDEPLDHVNLETTAFRNHNIVDQSKYMNFVI